MDRLLLFLQRTHLSNLPLSIVSQRSRLLRTAVSKPRSVRWCAMSATSPNHDGVEGTDWGEVWMLTAEGAILLMKPPFEEILLFFFPFKEAHFSTFYHP